MDDLVAQLTGITGTSDYIARQLLEMANNDLGQAVVLFYDTDMATVLARQEPSATSSTAAAAGASTSASTSRSNRPSAAAAARASSHRQDGDGVIHIADSDDDDDADVGDLYNADDFQSDDDDMTDIAGGAAASDDAAAVALRAQEEEDAAMAQRLQQEMYAEQGGAGRGGGAGGAAGGGGGGGGWQDEDDVRAPMARTTETLIDPVYGGGGGGYDGYDYAGASVFQRMRQQQHQQRQRGGPMNPFNQVWDNDDDDDDDVQEVGPGGGAAAGFTDLDTMDDAEHPAVDAYDPIAITTTTTNGRGTRGRRGGARGGRGSGATATSSRQARLADLFRPPYDLMDHTIRTWDDARAVGKDEKKWILANIQDMSDFSCQALNRDIWKDETIRQLVRVNFVFLQYSKEDMAAESYIQFYMPGGQHENPDNYPHIGIVDPRTGEQVKVWSGRPFPSALEFHAQLVEFLDRYSLDSSKKNPVQRSKPAATAASSSAAATKDVGRMTEDEMLEMALKNSLETAGGSGAAAASSSGSGSGSVNGSRPVLTDPDELTTDGKGKGKGKADEEEEAAEDDEDLSAFVGIAADRPHDEPPAGPTVTRIQFRHPGGRVIRRFSVSDPVERIYEWLKAAPLVEGKEGVEFELKPVPATPGRDLLEELGKTIEEAELKQATVMVEYME